MISRYFHVYLRVSYLGQDIIFIKELNNPHDCFAVVENAMLPGKICRETVGRVPRKMSCSFWYIMTAGAEFFAEVISVSPKVSQPKQDRQKKIIAITVKWEKECKY